MHISFQISIADDRQLAAGYVQKVVLGALDCLERGLPFQQACGMALKSFDTQMLSPEAPALVREIYGGHTSACRVEIDVLIRFGVLNKVFADRQAVEDYMLNTLAVVADCYTHQITLTHEAHPLEEVQRRPPLSRRQASRQRGT